MGERKFKDGSESVSFKEATAYTLRAVQMIRKIQPIMLELQSVLFALYAIQPVITLYFSSRILTELAGERRVNTIALFAALTVGIAFLFGLITSFLQHYLSTKGYGFGQLYAQFDGTKFAEMDYAYVEDAEVYQLREDINMKANNEGLGLSRVNTIAREIFGRLVGFLASVSLLAGMFGTGSGSGIGSGSGSGIGAGIGIGTGLKETSGIGINNLSVMFITSPWVIVLLLAATVAMPALTQILLSKRMNRLMLTISAQKRKTNAVTGYYDGTYIRNYNSGKDVRIFGIKDAIMAALEKRLDWFKGEWQKAGREANAITAAVGVFFSVLAYLVIGLRAVYGLYDVGEVTRYVGAVAVFSGNVVQIISALSRLYQNAPYLAMLYDFLDLPSQKYKGSLTTEKRTDNEYEIEFHHVSFKYPGAKTYALKDINMKLQVGKRLAVVGRNGSGKTTLIKLLCRLYDPTEGVITLNGVDIKKYLLHDYLRLFSVVFQDFALMHLPLGENVAASDTYDADAVTAALEKVGFGERLRTLEMGLDTPLFKVADYEGVLISGGEAQKIALARALYKDAPFIILDEPTAALDPLAEYEIYTQFDNIVGSKTAIYISHRLSSCRFCDDIAVFKDGALIQRGSHEELLAEAGVQHGKSDRTRRTGASNGTDDNALDGATDGMAHDATDRATNEAQDEYNRLWSAQAQHYNDPSDAASPRG